MDDWLVERMAGSIDMHVHSAPSHFQRESDDFEILRDLDACGMDGAVLKVHYGSTTARARLLNRHASGKARLFGSTTLNRPVGGLNPAAVESDLLLGASIIWFPTVHARNHMRNVQKEYPLCHAEEIFILDENGMLLPVVYEIIRLAVRYDGILATGHMSPAESIALCQAVREAGGTVILTHPEGKFERIPEEVQIVLAKQGVFIEKCWANVRNGHCSPEEMAARIRAIGAENCVMTTDAGKEGAGSAADQLAQFLRAMSGLGIGDAEFDLMLKENPHRLLCREGK